MKGISMIRRAVFGFLAAVVISITGTLAMAADSPKDIPAGHVAADSVKLLISRGYLPLYDDGTFKGNNPVDRYTLALAVGKILKDLDSGKVKMSDEDLKLVQKLSTEFREELVAQGLQVDKLRADVGSIKGDITAKDALEAKMEAQQSADIAALTKKLNQISDSSNALGSKLASVEDKTSKGQITQDQLKAMSVKIDQLEQELTAVRAKSDTDLSYMKTIAVVGTLGGVLLSILVGSAVH